jgi:peptide/nickel transport system ATP-binding protein
VIVSAPVYATAGNGWPSQGVEPTLLSVKDLVTTYPISRGLMGTLRRAPKQAVHAVDGVSFSLVRGGMLALVGESGCGKTSIAQTVLRMVDPVSGTILFQGQDITKLTPKALRPLRARMQMIYQDPYESLDPRFRVSSVLAEPLAIHEAGISKADRRRRMLDALERADMTPAELYVDRYPHELSGGQRQRVAIAAGLILQPDLLVADEPVSMLDVSVRAGILSLFDRLRREGLGILMITHDLSTAAHFADRIAVMYLGRILEEGTAREVVCDPQHPYTQALLSVVPRRNPADRNVPEILKGETPSAVQVPSGCRFHPRCPQAVPDCSAVDPQLGAANGAKATDHLVACILATSAALNR